MSVVKCHVVHGRMNFEAFCSTITAIKSSISEVLHFAGVSDPLTLWLYLREDYYQLVVLEEAVTLTELFRTADGADQSMARHFLLHPHGMVVDSLAC